MKIDREKAKKAFNEYAEKYDSSIENGIYFFEPLISFNDFSIEL